MMTVTNQGIVPMAKVSCLNDDTDSLHTDYVPLCQILSVVADYTTADGWTFSDTTKRFYQVFSNNPGTFTTANKFCQSKNSSLASINSDAEFNWLQTFINTNNKAHVWVYI